MGTWAMLLVAISTVACAQETQSPSPPSSYQAPLPIPPPARSPTPPTRLETAHIDPTSLFLRWAWTNDNVGLEDAKFEVNAVPSEGEARIASVEGKLYLVLDHLAKNTDYEITVAFVDAMGTKINGDSLKIKTLDKDVERPSNLRNKNGDNSDPDTVLYTTTWEFDDPPADGVKGFKVLYCELLCEAEYVDNSVFVFDKRLKYYTNYTVLVSAVFAGVDGRKHEIASALSILQTITGKPGSIEVISIHQIPNTLAFDLIWLPPARPNGKIESYDLEILAGGNIIFKENLAVFDYRYRIKKREYIAETLMIRVRAVNNGDEDSKYGDFAEKSWNLTEPAESPTSVELLARRKESLEIGIDTKDQAELFEISYMTNRTKETDVPWMVLDGFQAYTEVPLTAAVCVPLEDDDRFCGLPYKASFYTNVGAPSQVRNLTLGIVNNSVVLSWIEPEYFYGPLDGYIVRISDKTKKKIVDDVIANVSEYTFAAVENCTEYEFGIMAFNNDLASPLKLFGSISDAQTLKTGNCNEHPTESEAFPTWAIVLIILLVLITACGGTFYVMNMRRGVSRYVAAFR